MILSARAFAPELSQPIRALLMENLALLFYKPFGAHIQSRKWAKPEWTLMSTKELSVCWENLADSSPAFREAVKDAISGTWARYSLIRFAGWEIQCPPKGIDIRIAIGPEAITQFLGNKLHGLKNGVTLVNDFSTYTYCQSKPKLFCEKAAAVHEFGHALSLAHEQNREDAKDFCVGRNEGENPDFYLTVYYDPQSIMNYCNKEWNNDGLLSEGDIESIRKLYGSSDIM